MKRNLYQQLQTYSICWMILLLYSCTIVKFESTMPSQPVAKYYTFSKETTSFSSFFDTSVIYLFSGDMVISDTKYKKIETTKLYQFIVLKSNGKAFYSNFSRDPITQGNIYSIGGQYCFYKVEEGEFQIEVYDIKLRKFQILHFRVFPDKIHYYKDKLRIAGGGTSRQDLTFIRSSIKYSMPLIWPQ